MCIYAHFACMYGYMHVCVCTTWMLAFLEAKVGAILPVPGVTDGFESEVHANC